MGGVCTYQLADVIIMFCAANDQNMAGIFEMATNFKNPELIEYRDGRALEVMIVPARVDKDDSTLVDEFQKDFLEIFKNFELSQLGGGVKRFWDLNIPYVPKYAFRETVAIRETGLASAEDMVKAYVSLAETMALLAPIQSCIYRYAKQSNQVKKRLGSYS